MILPRSIYKMNIFTKLFPRRRPRLILLPTLLIEPPLDEVRLEKTLRLHFKHPGVQALIQALETEAAAENALALSADVIAQGRQAGHAGGATALLRVLGELEKVR